MSNDSSKEPSNRDGIPTGCVEDEFEPVDDETAEAIIPHPSVVPSTEEPKHHRPSVASSLNQKTKKATSNIDCALPGSAWHSGTVLRRKEQRKKRKESSSAAAAVQVPNAEPGLRNSAVTIPSFRGLRRADPRRTKLETDKQWRWWEGKPKHTNRRSALRIY
jgi:hypothetical protein